MAFQKGDLVRIKEEGTHVGVEIKRHHILYVTQDQGTNDTRSFMYKFLRNYPDTRNGKVNLEEDPDSSGYIGYSSSFEKL